MLNLLIGLVLAITSVIGGHAQTHADYLASSGAWHHSDLSPLTEVCDWAGENIYRGSDPANRWEAYAESPEHNAVMNHAHTHHTAGKAQMDDGRWVVVDVFCVAAAEETTAPTTTPTTTKAQASTSTTTTAPRIDRTPEAEPKDTYANDLYLRSWPYPI